MASSRKRCTSDEVVTFFRTTESSNKESEQAEEYIVVDLTYLQDDESPQEVTNDEDLYQSINQSMDSISSAGGCPYIYSVNISSSYIWT